MMGWGQRARTHPTDIRGNSLSHGGSHPTGVTETVPECKKGSRLKSRKKPLFEPGMVVRKKKVSIVSDDLPGETAKRNTTPGGADCGEKSNVSRRAKRRQHAQKPSMAKTEESRNTFRKL